MTHVPRFLVVGAESNIGKSLIERLAGSGAEVYGTTRRRDLVSSTMAFLDLEQDVLGWEPPCRPSVAFLCAAVTSLEACRRDSVRSSRINVSNTLALAKVLSGMSAFVIFLSTNQVFDGSQPFQIADAPTCSKTAYGRQKTEAEKGLLELGKPFSIVRFTKVLGPHTPLLHGWVQALRQDETIHPFSDLVMSPVPLTFAVDVLIGVAQHELSGIVQVSGQHDVTYEQVAQHIAMSINAKPHLVQAIKANESGMMIESLCPNTTLDTSRLRQELGLTPPDIWKTIDEAWGP